MEGRVLVSDQIFDEVRSHLAVDLDFDWTAGNVTAMIVDSGGGALWTPDPTDDVVATILAAGAVEAATPADRQTLTTPTSALSGADHLVYMDSDPVVYPNIPNATTYDTLVLFQFVTNDADSWLIAAYDLGAQTGDGSNVTVNPNTLGWLAW